MNGIKPFTVSYSPRFERVDSWSGETYPAAVTLCAIGFFMRILLSGPVLNILGINYGSEDASTIAKIHPGTWLIVLSFFTLICSRQNPFEGILKIARQQTAFFSLFAAYTLAIIYWTLRGPAGIGVLLDVHLVMPICAIVFSYATRKQCRMLVYGFAAVAVLNSVVGIGESLTHKRIFPFDPEWEVLQQDYFRASAFLGHPLTNASFAAVSIFLLLGMRLKIWVKVIAFFIMLASLVAFGGRSAIGFSLVALTFYGIFLTVKAFTSQRVTVLRLTLGFIALIIVPALCAGLLYGALHSGMGERLMAYSSLNDDSANVRMASLQALEDMSSADILFGVDSERVAQIGGSSGLSNPTSDIENPWILMFMFLGSIMFTIWILALLASSARLIVGAPLALQIAVLEYFAIASTSNSFGRKDPVLTIMAGMVVLIKRLDKLENFNHRETHP